MTLHDLPSNGQAETGTMSLLCGPAVEPLEDMGAFLIRNSGTFVRTETARCVAQLQAVLGHDPALAALIDPNPYLETPDMTPDPLRSLEPAPRANSAGLGSAPSPDPSYFDQIRTRLNQPTLRLCQREALTALAN